jgi:hypothetical protein
MRQLRTVVLLAVVLLAQPLFAQQDEAAAKKEQEKQPVAVTETAPVKDYYLTNEKWGLGIQLGTLSGLGIGVRYHPMGRFSLQLGGGALKTDENWGYNVGLEGQYDFDTFGLSRFYGLIGIGFYDHNASQDANLLNGVRFGVGAGYEWEMSRNLIFSFALAFNYYPHDQFFPYPHVGFYYYFD